MQCTPQAAPATDAGLSTAEHLRFRVSATRPDGCTTEYTAIGGTSCGHTMDAIDLAGLGGVVRVVPLAEADAA